MTPFRIFAVKRMVWLVVLSVWAAACKPESHATPILSLSRCMEIAVNVRIPTRAPLPVATPYAPFFHGSPLTIPFPQSPLPTPLPTFAPIPALTPTPSPLRIWPTATPLPVRPQVEVAQQFVATQQGIPVDQLYLSFAYTVVCPSNGEELELLRLGDKRDGVYYYVLVDQTDRAAYAPDFSEQAIALVARREGITADNLLIVNKLYTALPFVRQAVQRFIIINTTSSRAPEYAIDFDLEGSPVEFKMLQVADKSARDAQCPKLDDSLCLDLVNASPDDEREVNITLIDGANLDAVTQRIKQAGYQYRYEQSMIRTRLPKYFVLELTQLEMVRRIFRGYADFRIESLASNVFFAIEAAGDQVVLTLRTEKIYGCNNYTLDLDALKPDAQRIEIGIKGIRMTSYCSDEMGPAKANLDLGRLSGEYDLVFVYQPENLLDQYRLNVVLPTINIEPISPRFTSPVAMTP